MSPRPTATCHDTTAVVCLNAAAQLIDASLAEDSQRASRRLRSLHYPAALDWIRIEDVLRLAHASGNSVSKRALLNRWPTKDEFIRDAVVHAMLYRDDDSGDPVSQIPTLQMILDAGAFSAGVAAVTDNLLEVLITHPRSFLLAHIAPLLPRHTALANDIRDASAAGLGGWAEKYRYLLDMMGLELRHDWPVERLAFAIQLVLDGVVIRSRIPSDSGTPPRWTMASIYADTVLAIISAALDPEGDGLSMRDWLDHRVQAATRTTAHARG